MGTASLTAGEVMDRSAALMNDPAKTDYTYVAQLPYLNMAINELNEYLEESNVPVTNQTSVIIGVNAFTNMITNLPLDLVEIQEVGERQKGDNGPFRLLKRVEFPDVVLPGSSLLFWYFENQQVRFSPAGATSPMEVQLKYVRRSIPNARDEDSLIDVMNSVSYLTYKTAALCAMFIGENETRAEVLDDQADKALERIIGISNKGKQQIVTRHRPFRAAYKMRGY